MKTIISAILMSILFLSTTALADESRAKRIDEQVIRTAKKRKSTSKGELITGRLSRASMVEIPGLMSFQGTLTDDAGTCIDTILAMTFSIYPDSAGEIPVWTETQSDIQVNGGIFNVLLGRSTGIPDTVFSDPERWLSVQVGGDSELKPRHRIAAVGYAFQAGSDGDWTVSGNNLSSEVPGNVGIGTTSPGEKLHISDNLRVDGTLQTDWLSEVTDSAGITLLSDIDFNNHLQLPASYIIFTDGDSTIYALNGETGRIDYQGTDAAGVIRQTVAKNRKVFIKNGLYPFSSPVDLDSSFILELEPGAILEVPNGYSSYVFGFVDQGDHLGNASIAGGKIREAGSPQRLWQAVLLKSSGKGILFNTVKDICIVDAGVAITLLIDDSEGWINGNEFKSIRIWHPRIFIDFVVSADTARGFHRNYFEDIMGQAQSYTTYGARNVRDIGNVFLDVKFWDLHYNPSAISASISEYARDTIILGGIMSNQNFEDNGIRTQIIDGFQYADLKDATIDDLTVGTTSALDVRGTLSVGVDGAGHDVTFYGNYLNSRFQWDQAKMALRAGWDSDTTHWVPDSIGTYSVATGYDTKALGAVSTAMGRNTVARGNYATALGQASSARGNTSLAMGYTASAWGDFSTAMGNFATADANYSMAIGRYVTSDTLDAMVIGRGINQTGPLVNGIKNSLMVGFNDTTAALFVGGMDNRVGIGTSTPTRKLWVNGDAGGATDWYNDSDERLKKNITPIEDALDKISRLEGVYFEWQDAENRPDGRRVGLIAQEVEKVVPEVVDKKGEFYSMATAGLVPVLIEAIKEQQEQIDELRAKLAKLQ